MLASQIPVFIAKCMEYAVLVTAVHHTGLSAPAFSPGVVVGPCWALLLTLPRVLV
jgi:hypothetical protein